MAGCRKVMPDASFVYLGDHANAPYGHRDNLSIVERTKAGVNALFEEGCTLVVLACNTAAAIALRTLQKEWLPKAWPDRNILGVLVPMVEAVSTVPWASDNPSEKSIKDKRTIILFATRKTVESGAYAEELAKRAPNLTLIQKACPGLVDALEGGAGELPLAGLVKGYVAEACSLVEGGRPDAAVLGCTHFPLVEKYFQRALGASVPIYSQPEVVAAALESYRISHPHYSFGQTGTTRLLSTSARGDIMGLDSILPHDHMVFEKLYYNFYSSSSGADGWPPPSSACK